ncbi:MAG: phytanoyl-CoA dioxygenase family protein [Vicinamibacterales bacterium]
MLRRIFGKPHAVTSDPGQNDALAPDPTPAVAKPADLERAPALTDRSKVAQHRNARGELDYDETMLPWIDQPDADVDRYVRALPQVPPGLRNRLEQWRDQGFVVLEQAIEHRLIDAYVADVKELFEHHRQFSATVGHPKRGTLSISELTDAEVRDRHLRLVNFHNPSLAAKKLALAGSIIDFLEHVFREQVVAMQSLTFRYGTEQHVHQDYAYVVSGNPSHLAAAWIALEDIHPDAGPLGYFPGSHRIPKYDWGNGLFYVEKESVGSGAQFQDHILSECRKRGVELATFLPRKGDVFLWHGSLAHGGTPQRDTDRTRLSFVAHYSSVPAFPSSPHDVQHEPQRFELNRGVLYLDPTKPESEDVFRHGADV